MIQYMSEIWCCPGSDTQGPLLLRGIIFGDTSITRMHSNRMRAARSSSRWGEGVVCLSACWETPPPGVGLEIPLDVDLEIPLQARSLNLLPGCGPGDPPPWRPAVRHTGIPPARHARIPPPAPL